LLFVRKQIGSQLQGTAIGCQFDHTVPNSLLYASLADLFCQQVW